MKSCELKDDAIKSLNLGRGLGCCGETKRCFIHTVLTPPKNKMEPENHPIEKEQSSSIPPFLISMLVFQSIYIYICKYISFFQFRYMIHYTEFTFKNIILTNYIWGIS